MHYTCEVWIPTKPETRSEAEAIVTEILAPYSEQVEGNRRRSFHDYYMIGGRYTGRHTGYNPYEDIINQEVCNLCYGTGRRPDADEAARLVTRGCNGCRGTGMEVKWNLEPYEGDILELEKVKDTATCYTLIIARPDKRTKVIHEEKWNGTAFLKTGFDGKVKPYLKKAKITTGCLITVDYHC